MRNKFVFLLIFLFSIYAEGLSQSVAPYEDIRHSLDFKPGIIETWGSGCYVSHGESIYNVKSGLICKLNGDVLDFKVSSDGKTYSVIYKGKEGNKLFIGDLWTTNKEFTNVIIDYSPSKVCYKGNELIVADNAGNIYFYSISYKTKTFSRQGKLKLNIDFAPDCMIISDDANYLAIAYSCNFEIYDIEKQLNIVTENMSGNIRNILFSDKSKSLNILSDNGCFYQYDVSDFVFTRELIGLGQTVDFAMHPNGKYIIVATKNNTIELVNIFNPLDRVSYDIDEKIIESVKLLIEEEYHNSLGYILFGTLNSIVYKPITQLKPNYTALVNEEVDNMMGSWLQRMDGETLEEYNLRVTDENIANQRRLYEEEISTVMAGDMFTSSDVSLRDFNMESNTLALNIGDLPTIYLDVPPEDVGFFNNQENLSFSNAKYIVNDEDKFELVHLDVSNTQTGKTYTFDNKERLPLEYMYSSESFIPIDMALMSNMEEVMLQSIKKNIVEQARSENYISDKTSINVSSKTLSRVDKNGEKIYDYMLNFQYSVEAAYSHKEDFSPGEYHLDMSGAAKSLGSVIAAAFENDFAKYIASGKKLKVKIVGMADNMAIKNRIHYDGVYGDYIDQPISNLARKLTVTTATGIRNNEQLALIRAASIKHFICENIPALHSMDVDYQYDIIVANLIGGEHRRISVEFMFEDVF